MWPFKQKKLVSKQDRWTKSKPPKKEESQTKPKPLITYLWQPHVRSFIYKSAMLQNVQSAETMPIKQTCSVACCSTVLE